jgi:hypothetical protein
LACTGFDMAAVIAGAAAAFGAFLEEGLDMERGAVLKWHNHTGIMWRRRRGQSGAAADSRPRSPDAPHAEDTPCGEITNDERSGPRIVQHVAESGVAVFPDFRAKPSNVTARYQLSH